MGRRVGLKHESDDEVAHVFLDDGLQAVFGLETGDLQLLSSGFQFFCLYQSADCSGACYVYDHRWLDVLVLDADGGLRVARRSGAVNAGVTTMGSLVDASGQCEAAAFDAPAAYVAEAYSLPGGLTAPLSAPLYWQRLTD